MKIKDITGIIEKIAPLTLQEDYDNAGLIIGDSKTEVTGILLSLDVTENVINEALQNNCNLIICHHPIIFKGLKKLNGKSYVERTVIHAVKNNIAIYAAHTNLDNVLNNGVNYKIAEKLGLENLKILRPTSNTINKLAVYCPTEFAEVVRDCLFENGAGAIGNYSECSFTSSGIGTFKPGLEAHPHTGSIGERTNNEELKIEVLIQNHQITNILDAIKKVHPYEEVAYDILPLKNHSQMTGAGIIGDLPSKMEAHPFLSFLKERMNLKIIRHTTPNQFVEKIAICGGSGSFLINDAKSAKADAYVTADLKYHEFFDAENQILLCDIGHYESEIYTLEIFYDVIKENFPTFAVIFCKENTNPIQYFK